MSHKTISIPESFFSTKKKRPVPRPPKVPSTKTVRRNHVLKFIRNEQEKTYRKLLQGDGVVQEAADQHEDFQQSLDYLMSLTREEEEKKKSSAAAIVVNQAPQTHTLKQRPQALVNPVHHMMDENVSLVFPSVVTTGENAVRLAPPKIPQWGCLRNGNLPTYRSWQTQKNRAPQPQPEPQPWQLEPQPWQPEPQPWQPQPEPQPWQQQPDLQPVDMDVLQMRQTMDLVEKTRPNLMAKQQRTVRKTYRVGRNLSQISVLVSNKTLRNRVTARTHEMRQRTMEEVKKYLINKGFVRIGTSAPNDVLRKMYESAQLICGEIQNHNPDNLLFNFLHNGSSGTL